MIQRLLAELKCASKRETTQRIWLLLAISIWLLLTSLWLLTSWKLHHPFPFADDYNSCLTFLADWLEHREISLLFASYNEAPTLLLKLAVLTSYYLLGSVSFSFLAVVASLSPILVSLTLVFWLTRYLRVTLAVSLLLNLPTLILLTQPAVWGSYLWATSAYIHGFLPLMALLSLIALERGAIASALLIGAAAAFFGGAGLFVAALVCLFTILKFKRSKITWGLVVGAGILGLIRIYSIGSNSLLRSDIRDFLDKESSLKGLFSYPLAFVGNAFDISDPIVACALGACLIAISLYIRLWRYPPLFAVFILSVCAGGSSALLRFSEGGIEHALLSRYQVYSTTAWAAIFTALIITASKLRWIVWGTALLITGALALRSYSDIPKTVTPFNLKLARELVAYRFDPTITLAEFPPRQVTDYVLQRASRLGIYSPDPTAYLNRFLERDLTLPEQSADLIINIEQYAQDRSFIFIRGDVSIKADQIVTPRSVCLLAIGTGSESWNRRLCLPSVRGRDLLPAGAAPVTVAPNEKAYRFALLVPFEVLPDRDFDLALMALGNRNWHVKALPREPQVKQPNQS